MFAAAVSSAVLAVSSTATGASFTVLTVIVTVAVFELSVPSETLYLKLAVPLKLAVGSKVNVEPVILAVPFTSELATKLYVKVSPVFASVAFKLPEACVSSLVVTATSLALGAKLIVIVVSVSLRSTLSK